MSFWVKIMMEQVTVHLGLLLQRFKPVENVMLYIHTYIAVTTSGDATYR